MRSRITIAVLLMGTAISVAPAAEPTIRNIDVRGLRIGGTTTLAIDGDDLGKTPRLMLPFPAKQSLKPGNTDKKAVFDVTLDANVVPGYDQLRIVTDEGVSLPTPIAVDRLPQMPLGAATPELPIALHGTVAGGSTVETKFTGKAKQKVMVEVEAARLGSKLRPIIHLYTPKKLQLAWSWGTPALHGDTRLEAILPDDGVYTVAFHDVEYAAVAPSFFRLRIGEWSYVDQVFPPAVSRAKNSPIELIGGPAKVASTVNTKKGIGFEPVIWPKDGLWSGPRPFVAVGAHPEYLKQPAKDKPQDLPAGVLAVSGKLVTPFDEDRYRLAVTPGKKIRLEVFAERIGSPIDLALVVRNEKGDQLARAEDSPGTLDPVLEYAVPDKVTSIIVGVVDSQGRAGPRCIYRLVVEPQGDVKDFKLTTPLQRIALPIGGRTVFPVLVERRGYAGKIDLAANFPAGVKVEEALIPEGADGALVTLQRGDAPFEPVITTWRGRGSDGTEHAVNIKGHPLESIQPWLANEISIAPTNRKAAEFVIDWKSLPADAALVPGMKLALPITAKQPLDKTTIKLTLLTSQVTPLVNNQPDPNKSLRQEKPVELPVKASDGEIAILVPVELSAPVYDVTVQAELLDAAKKPLAVAYAPVRRMAVRMPLVVKLDGPSRIETAYDGKKGATIKLQGKIERIAGVKSDVALALTGLPAGAKADAVTVKADASDFAINVTFPPNVPAGEYKAVKLSGSIAPEPKTPAVRVKSRDMEIDIVLKAPIK